MMHMIAFYKSVLTSGTFQSINLVSDGTVSQGTANNGVIVPAKLTNVVLAQTSVSSNSVGTKAQLISPSLRELYNPTLPRLVLAAQYDNVRRVNLYPDNPIPVEYNEELDIYTDGGGNGTTAADVYGIVILADGPIQPAKGSPRTIRATAAVTNSAGKWVNGSLTFDQSLPVGTYEILGMRAYGTGLVAARLVFVGGQNTTRPGCLGVSSEMVDTPEGFAQGQLGSLGSFDSTQPPSVDCLGSSGTAQTFMFDLVKTA